MARKMTSQEWMEKVETAAIVLQIITGKEAPDNVRGELDDPLAPCPVCGNYKDTPMHALGCTGARA